MTKLSDDNKAQIVAVTIIFVAAIKVLTFHFGFNFIAEKYGIQKMTFLNSLLITQAIQIIFLPYRN